MEASEPEQSVTLTNASPYKTEVIGCKWRDAIKRLKDSWNILLGEESCQISGTSTNTIWVVEECSSAVS
jgi:hypothetical protein